MTTTVARQAKMLAPVLNTERKGLMTQLAEGQHRHTSEPAMEAWNWGQKKEVEAKREMGGQVT